MKSYLLTFLLFLVGLTSWSQTIETFRYAEKDTTNLFLDVYKPAVVKENLPCVLFIFGGGFIKGSRNEKDVVEYCKALTEKGFIVVPIDYRLGLVGAKNVGLLNYKPVKKAIEMATEDAISALSYLVQNAESLNIDKKRSF
jgi:Carboxylesterase type B